MIMTTALNVYVSGNFVQPFSGHVVRIRAMLYVLSSHSSVSVSADSRNYQKHRQPCIFLLFLPLYSQPSSSLRRATRKTELLVRPCPYTIAFPVLPSISDLTLYHAHAEIASFVFILFLKSLRAMD